jgi:hypothetical protein
VSSFQNLHSLKNGHRPLEANTREVEDPVDCKCYFFWSMIKILLPISHSPGSLGHTDIPCLAPSSMRNIKDSFCLL